MPAERQTVLAGRIWKALGLGGEPDGNVRPLDFEDGDERQFRVYLWTCTPDRSASGRPKGEYKVQLILPGQTAGDRGRLNLSDGAHVSVVGYAPDMGVFVVWDARLHRDFGYSKNVQVPEALLDEAVRFGWSADSRRVQLGDEVRVAVMPWKLLDVLQVLAHADDEGLEGDARLSFVNSILSSEDDDIPWDHFFETDGNAERRRYTASRTQRDPRFAPAVRREYGDGCAVCGHQLGVVEAAHIIPVSERDSRDESWNGIALCPTHHRLFDRNLFTVIESLKIAVDGERLDLLAEAGLGEGGVALQEMDGTRVARPASWGDPSFRHAMREAIARRNALIAG